MRAAFLLLFLIAICILFPSAPIFAAVIHVPGDRPTIQAGIDIAVDGDMVLVAVGTYQEIIDFKGKAITVKNAAGPAKTIIDGNKMGSVVTFNSGEGPDSVLQGFTITNGDGTPDYFSQYGGGIYCKDASPTIIKNIIRDNEAFDGFYTAGSGGGIYSSGGSPTIKQNTIFKNKCIDSGGGIYIYGSAIIHANRINDNSTGGSGGGIRCSNGTTVISDNIISNNRANDIMGKSYGAGISCSGTTHIIGNRISSNITGAGGSDLAWGGGIYCMGDITIENNLIAINIAKGDSTIFYGKGGGIYCGGTVAINNNTIFANTVNNEGGGIYIAGGIVQIKNSILWNNSGWPKSIAGTPSEVSYSDVEGGTGKPWFDPMTCIDTDPLLATGHFGGYYLQQPPLQPTLSPCVDAGDPTSPMIEGTTRTDGGQDTGTVDMGYHYPLYVFHVPDQYATIQKALDEAGDGFTVLVAPGTYPENIDFLGKDVTVRSDGDGDAGTVDLAPEITVLDGQQTGRVVTFKNGEGPEAVLEGFTVTNGQGGVFCQGASPVIQHNILCDNQTAFAGGGIMCRDGSGAQVLSNLIFSNSAALYGGGMACYDSAPLIVNNLFFDNQCLSTGGIGGGMGCWKSSPTLVNNTFFHNQADDKGGGLICHEASSPSVTNTIFWGDAANTDPEISVGVGSNPQVTYCDVEGGWTGAGNIALDPLLVDTTDGDLHLFYTSPCRDAGDNGAANLPAEDFEGDPRIAGTTVDMGADEFHRHLYHTGEAAVGGSVKMKFLGMPGSSPVGLIIGVLLFDPPLPGAFGDWYIAPPWAIVTGLPPIPAEGVMVLSGTIPSSVPAPVTLYFQALIGNQLSNLAAMHVQ